MDKYGFAEIEAMRKIAEALTGLEQNAIQRVLAWVNDKYQFEPPGEDRQTTPRTASNSASAGELEKQQPPLLGEFYTLASPATDAEKALVVSYWLQFHKHHEEFNAATINTQLKNLGYRVSNITRAFSHLQSKQPQLAIQTKKLGNTKQARKKYQVTNAGKRYVEDMLKKAAEN